MLVKTNHIVLFLYLLIVLQFSCSNGKTEAKKNEVLAEINNLSLTVEQYQNAYEYWYRKTGYVLEPNSTNRLSVLENEFNKLVLAQVAIDRGYNQLDDVKFEEQLIERQFIIDLFQKEFIENKMVVSEKDIREAFIMVNTRFNASHLFAKNYEDAIELKNRLQKGETFESLAKEVFKTPYLANNGGDVGDFGFDEMDIAFELAAYGAKLDSVVGPVKTAQGYSLIKVSSRYTKPIITENEYNTVKSNLEVITRRRLSELAKRSFTENFSNKFVINADLLNQLWSSVNKNIVSNREENGKRQSIIQLANQYKDNVIGTFNNKPFMADQILMELYFSPNTTIDRINDINSFKNMIAGLSLRVYQIQKVESAELLITEDIQERINYSKLMNLNEVLITNLENEITIPEYDCFDYYNNNKSFFEKPLEFDFIKIVTESKEKAQIVRDELIKGTMNVGSLISKYSIDKESMLNDGRTGLLPINELGTMALKLNKLKIGQVSEIIIREDNEFHVYKCLVRNEPRMLSYEESRKTVENMLKKQNLEIKKAKIISDAKKMHRAKIYNEKVQTIDLKLN